MRRLALSLLPLALAACGQGERAPDAPRPMAPVPPAAAPTPVAASVPDQPASRTFRDWRAACDNGGRCFAWSGSDQGGWVLLKRDAGPGVRPELLAGMPNVASATGGLTLDGRTAALVSGATPGALAVAPARLDETLTRLAQARTIALKVGEMSVDIPTNGAAAALLWIDERQGRLDAVDALIRRGGRPGEDAPPAPSLPRLTPAPAADQTGLSGGADPTQDLSPGPALPAAIAALPAVKACQAETSFNPDFQKSVFAVRLSRTRELWGAPCSLGAYNAGYAMFLTGPNGANPQALVLPTTAAQPTRVDQDFLINPVFDAKTRTLSHFPRGRGLGDCGVMQSWVWTGQAFALKQESVMGDCWGMPQRHWPTTWRSL